MYVIHACFTVMYSLSSEGNEIMGENFCCVCRLHHILGTGHTAAFLLCMSFAPYPGYWTYCRLSLEPGLNFK